MTLPMNSSNAKTERLARVREALRIATRDLEAFGNYDDPDLLEAQLHVLGAVSAIAIAAGKVAR